MTLTEKLQSIGPGETPEGELDGGIGIGPEMRPVRKTA